ncbi:MAG: FGGY-family carbohydrate kinase [Pirellulaceae bacterium]|nr:FGGY-family carbohydrate kinase [Pirellulaceae bacterium]
MAWTTEGYYLAIDAGTQSIRAAIVDGRGQILDIEKVAIEPYFSVQPGWAEQHPDYYWTMLCQSCNQLLQRRVVEPKRLSAVSLTSQRATMINVDATGQALRPAILWLDDRKAAMQRLLPAPIETLLRPLGIYSLLRHTYKNAEWNWLVQNQPDVVAATHKYLTLSGFLNFKLCGQYHESVASTVGYLPFDYKLQRWYSEGNWKRRLFDVPTDRLPQLFATGQQLGTITDLSARQTGIPSGLPLLAGAADKAAEVLGSGVINSQQVACLSLGTTATVQAVTARYREVERLVPLYPSAVAGMYNSEIMIYKGFWMISWFRDQFGHAEQQQAATQNVSPEKLLDQFLADVPAGCLGLMTQPYWGAGVRYPDPAAKGCVLGFGDVHTRPYLYRSIVEGLGYALKQGLQKTARRLGCNFQVVRIAGGGSQSDNIMQIMADICALPAERPHTFEASLLGTAVNMAVGLRHYPDYATAVSQMVRVGQRFEPITENVQLYRQLYDRIYLQMYRKLRPLYREIQAITGYPRP